MSALSQAVVGIGLLVILRAASATCTVKIYEEDANPLVLFGLSRLGLLFVSIFLMPATNGSGVTCMGGIKSSYSGIFGQRRISLYIVTGAVDALALMFQLLAYKYLNPSTVEAAFILVTPMALAVTNNVLHRAASMSEKCSLLSLSVAPASFSFVANQENQEYDTDFWLGFAMLCGHVFFSGVHTMVAERAHTKDRTLAEIVMYEAIFGGLVSVVGFALSGPIDLPSGLDLTALQIITVILLAVKSYSTLIVDRFVKEPEALTFVSPLAVLAVCAAQSLILGVDVPPIGWGLAIAMVTTTGSNIFIKTSTQRVSAMIFMHDVESRQFCIFRQKRGPFKGQFNGCGGKISQGEGPLIGAAREIQEETCLDVDLDKICNNLTYVGSEVTKGWAVLVFVLPVNKRERQTVTETEEGIPVWLDEEEMFMRSFETEAYQSEMMLMRVSGLIVARYFSGGATGERGRKSLEKASINLQGGYDDLAENPVTLIQNTQREIGSIPFAYRWDSDWRSTYVTVQNNPGYEGDYTVIDGVYETPIQAISIESPKPQKKIKGSGSSDVSTAANTDPLPTPQSAAAPSPVSAKNPESPKESPLELEVEEVDGEPDSVAQAM